MGSIILIILILLLCYMMSKRNQDKTENFYYSYPYYYNNCVQDAFGNTKCYDINYPVYRYPRYYRRRRFW